MRVYIDIYWAAAAIALSSRIKILDPATNASRSGAGSADFDLAASVARERSTRFIVRPSVGQ